LLRGRDVQELTELQRQGMSIQAISKLTGWDRKTVRKYLLQPNALPAYTSPRTVPIVRKVGCELLRKPKVAEDLKNESVI